MAEFKAKVTAELDTSGIKSQIQSLNNEKITLSVDAAKLRSQIEKSLQKSFKITVDANTSRKASGSKNSNGNGSVGLTNSQLRQIEAYRRKSQIRTGEFEKKSNLGVQNAKLKNIDKIETAQKQSDIRVREAQRRQDIKDASRRKRQFEAEAKRVQREQEKIRKLTDPNSAHERAYGGTYRRTYDEYLANGSSVEKAQKAGLSAVKSQKMEEFGYALDDLTRAGARYVALPIAAATVASVKAFMDYETAFTGVRKTVNGTEEELQAISDGIEEMALRVPVASTELANLAKMGGQLGVPTKSLLKFTETFAAMEVSTNLQGEEGASTLARFMNVMGENYDKIENVGSAIVDLGNNFATTESEIAHMGQRMGATASIIGMSSADVLGYAAALSTMGVNAEAGGSSMSRIWQNISKAVSSGGDDLKSFAKVSKMSAKDFAKAWKTDPTKAFNSLLKGLSKSSDLIGDLARLDINNIRDITAMQDLATRYDIVEEALKRANIAYSENTALATEADRVYSTTASKLQIAKESIVQAGRSVGEAVAPAVIDLAGGVQSAATGFANLSDTTKKNIVNFSLLTAGTLLSANGLAKAVKTAGELNTAFIKIKGFMAGGKMSTFFAGLGGAAPAILGVASAVTAVGVAAYKTKKHFDELETGATLGKEVTKIQKHSDKIVELNKLMSEVKDLEFVINSPDSSKEQLDDAKARIEEIAALLNKEYELNIRANSTEIKKTIEALTYQERGDLMDDVDTFVSKLKKTEYSEAKKSRPEQQKKVDDLSTIQRDLGNLVKMRDIYADAQPGSEGWTKLQEIELEISDYYKKIENMGYGDLVRSASDKMYGLDLIDIGSALGDAETKLEKANTTIENFQKNTKDAVDSLGKVLASDTKAGDSYGIRLDIAKFDELGRILKESGESTDYLAKKYAVAKEGFPDLSEAAESGNLDDVVQNYITFSKRFGESNVDITRNAALLKRGLADASQVTSESVSAIYEDMVEIGKSLDISDPIDNAVKNTALLAAGFNSVEEATDAGEDGLEKFLEKAKELGKSDATGLFKELGYVDKKGNDTNLAGQAEYLDSIANELNLLPENKTIAIDFKTGDVSVIDNLPDSKTIEIKAVADVESVLSEIESAIPEGETVTYAINAEGNIAVLSEAGDVIAELKGNNEITFKVNAEGNLEVLDGMDKKLQELDQYGEKKIEVGIEYKEGEIPDAEIPPETSEITYTPIVIKPVVDPETGEITYTPIVIKPTIAPETGNVFYQGTLLPFSLPTIDGGIANFTLGDSPDKVGDASGVANYTMGSFPTKAPDIYGKAYYTKVFTGGSQANGTAHADGTAFAGDNAKRGDWGTKDSGVALGGELGEELVVRDGKFFTIGSDAAEFFAYRKGDIIFNAEQTKQLLNSGKISLGNKRGKAFADGSSFSGEVNIYTTSDGHAISSEIASSYNSSSVGTTVLKNILNEFLDNISRQYKFTENELKYIEGLKEALETKAQSLEEKRDIEDKIEDAYKNHAQNRIDDLEHENTLLESLSGNEDKIIDNLKNIQNITHEEAERYRQYLRDQGVSEEDIAKNSYIQEMQSDWLDTLQKIADISQKLFEGRIDDLEHENEMLSNLRGTEKTRIDNLTKMRDAQHEEAERYRQYLRERGLSEEEIAKDDYIQERQADWWKYQNEILDMKLDNSEGWIKDRGDFNDWALFGDSEIDAWERTIEWLKRDYPESLEKIKDAEKSLFDARKKEFKNASDFALDYLDSQKEILQSHYDVTNAITEARYEIEKELDVSKTMHEYLDEETRKLPFNQEDFNKLNSELNKIESKSLKLKSDYEKALENSTLETVESITSEYKMQYETLMKSYEIAKADLEVAKKKAQLNNVLNERNVRMFINGSWQWVANTEDVATAKSELADAEYAQKIAKAGLTQQESIDELTKRQDEVSEVIKKFENGVISLDEAVGLASSAIGSLPNALKKMLGKSTGNTVKSNDGVWYDSSVDYAAKIQSASSLSEALRYNEQRNAKIKTEGRSEAAYSTSYIESLFANKNARGTGYTKGGWTLLGEKEPEMYINANGHLIPINRPTVGNIEAGGVVFNQRQMDSVRKIWDWANLGVSNLGGLYTAPERQSVNNIDNRIIINGMTVDGGSSDGQALIDAMRRYVGNH